MDKELPTYLGGNIDPRTEAEKSRDHMHEEVATAAATAIEWKEKTYDQLRRFPERFQAQSLMCMAQSGVKNLGIANFLLDGVFPILSALNVYRSRFNYPDGGMSLPDLFKLLTTPHAPLEADLPSQNLTEYQANAASLNLTPTQATDAKRYAADGYVYFTQPYKIDDIAAVLATGKSVELMMFFEGNEYWRPKPVIINSALNLYGSDTLRHGIAGVDNLLLDGEKTLYIEDSAGNWTGINGKGERYITEDFLKARCFGAGYIIKKGYADINKPKYSFTKPLVYGTMHNEDVKALQYILQYEKFFPTEIDGVPFAPTGNFLGMTADALKKWQIAHNIMDFRYELDMRKIRFGAKSIALANSIYSK